MTQFDTPDGQRGVVTAQQLLATVFYPESTVTVELPTNAQTIVVVAYSNPIPGSVTCSGVGSGFFYPGVALPQQGQTLSQQAFFFDVSAAVDEELNIIFQHAPIHGFAVYCDAGVHVMADASKLTNQLGQQYVVSTVPNILTGDHPPNELLHASASTPTTGALIAAPGAGQRIRIFSMALSSPAAGVLAVLIDLTSGSELLACEGPGSVALTLPAQGWPMTTDSELQNAIQVTAGTCFFSVWYTIEAV